MSQNHRGKRPRGPDWQQTSSVGLSQPSHLPSFDDTNARMMGNEAYYPQLPPSSESGLGQGLQALTIDSGRDQTFYQQSRLPSNASWRDGDQYFGSASHQTGLPPGEPLPPLPRTLNSSFNSLAGADGYVDQDNSGLNHDGSFSDTPFAGSQENSPGSSVTLDKLDPRDNSPPRPQQIGKIGKRRASQSVIDDTRAKKRSEAQKNTNKFVQEQQKRRLVSPSSRKEKHHTLLIDFDDTYEGGKPTKKTTQRTSPAQWPCSQSHYTQED